MFLLISKRGRYQLANRRLQPLGHLSAPELPTQAYLTDCPADNSPFERPIASGGKFTNCQRRKNYSAKETVRVGTLTGKVGEYWPGLILVSPPEFR